MSKSNKMKKKVETKKKPVKTGALLKRAIKKSGLPVKFVAEEKFDCSRIFLYRIMKSNKFPADKLKVAKKFIKANGL